MIESLVKRVLGRSMLAAIPYETHPRQDQARVVVEQWQDITKQQEYLTTEYGKLHDNKKRWVDSPKVCANLIQAVASLFGTLYRDPVVVKWDEKTKDGALAEATFAPMRERWLALMARIDILTFLAGTLAVRPIYREKQQDIKHAVYLPHQIEYDEDPNTNDPADPAALAFSWLVGRGTDRKTKRHLWTPEQFVVSLDDLVQENQPNPYGEISATVFRNDDDPWEFYGAPAFDLVQANLALNGLLSTLNLAALFQGFSTLFTVDAPDDWKPQLGIFSVVGVKNRPGGSGASVGYVTPAPNIAGIVETINTALKLFFAARRIPEAAVMAQQVGESGVSIVAQAASLVDYRRQRITQMRPLESALIRQTLKVLHYHTKGALLEFPSPQIQYTEMKMPMSVDEREEWDWLIGKGVKTELDLFKAKNPGSDKDAEAAWKKNMSTTREGRLERVPRAARQIMAEEGEE